MDDEAAQRDFDHWSALHDEYVEALEDGRRELADGSRHWFHFRIDPGPIVRELAATDADFSSAQWLGRYRDRVTDAFGPVASEAGLTLAIEPYGGAKTGGPVPDQQYVVGLIGIALDWMSNIVTIAGFAALLHALQAKAREVTQNLITVTDGLAIILAAEAIQNATGETELVLGFATASATYTPDRGRFEPLTDGWMVGFRGRDKLYLAHVDGFGKVSLVAEPVPVNWKPE